MKVLLTGATGYVGSAVADVLAEAEHEVLCLARSGASAERLRKRGFATATGDISEVGAVRDAARGCRAVVHAAASDGEDPGADDRAFLEGVFEALGGTGAVLIYTSGGWVMGDTDGALADEGHPLRPTTSLAWRPEVERLVLRSGAEAGLRPFVVRPALVYGNGGGVVGETVAFARERGYARYVARPGEDARWTLVHRRDVGRFYAAVIAAAADPDSPEGGIYILAGGPPVPAREVAVAASRAAGAEGRVEPWPLEEARKELGSYAEDLALDQRLCGRKAARDFGFEPESPYIFEHLKSGDHHG
ncbi:NADH(P)-binding [Rubrobacter radiotolerans]|uniref:NAD-dependent epimerase/dehydratase family protein n=1 Tax=Rubrobacter radiotolerans TaxID=42256 RepID=A0A023X640_RUBRA|nr:NAD-dependent epimerase/dehydratase family protein [Rubrobacter radiotolerans]AHY47465.1 NADH(P)-binding [Rubrobacter radiotolerans]MDX5894869.1 NAD-dependent epimerase/dehydratase family protein [Rubrobacter radiotolerans]SMC06952.1 Nucleoside-diphosphate-sugar epimerase [Rubrobacter radiotolerans DSM 5868]